MSRRLPPGLSKYRKKITVFVEGPCEKSYFNRINELDYFSDKSLTITAVNGKHNFLNNFYKRVQSLKQQDENSEFVILIDLDNGGSLSIISQLEDALKKRDLHIKPENIIFFNNYSFELFLINHKKQFTKPIDNKKQYKSHMISAFNLKDYKGSEKNFDQIFKNITIDDVNTALSNTKSLSQDKTKNPSSNMNSLFSYINSV